MPEKCIKAQSNYCNPEPQNGQSETAVIDLVAEQTATLVAYGHDIHASFKVPHVIHSHLAPTGIGDDVTLHIGDLHRASIAVLRVGWVENVTETGGFSRRNRLIRDLRVILSGQSGKKEEQRGEDECGTNKLHDTGFSVVQKASLGMNTFNIDAEPAFGDSEAVPL